MFLWGILHSEARCPKEFLSLLGSTFGDTFQKLLLGPHTKLFSASRRDISTQSGERNWSSKLRRRAEVEWQKINLSKWEIRAMCEWIGAAYCYAWGVFLKKELSLLLCFFFFFTRLASSRLTASMLQRHRQLPSGLSTTTTILTIWLRPLNNHIQYDLSWVFMGGFEKGSETALFTAIIEDPND